MPRYLFWEGTNNCQGITRGTILILDQTGPMAAMGRYQDVVLSFMTEIQVDQLDCFKAIVVYYYTGREAVLDPAAVLGTPQNPSVRLVSHAPTSAPVAVSTTITTTSNPSHPRLPTLLLLLPTPPS